MSKKKEAEYIALSDGTIINFHDLEEQVMPIIYRHEQQQKAAEEMKKTLSPQKLELIQDMIDLGLPLNNEEKRIARSLRLTM